MIRPTTRKRLILDEVYNKKQAFSYKNLKRGAI